MRYGELRGLTSRLGNPTEWSVAGKCALVLAIYLAFDLWGLLAGVNFARHPEHAPYFDQAVLAIEIRLLGVQSVLAVALLAWTLVTRRRAPSSHPLVTYGTAVLCGVNVLHAAYIYGTHTRLYTAAAICGSVAIGTVLFERWAVRLWLWIVMAALGAITLGEVTGIIHYAPLLARMPTHAEHLAPSWLLGGGGISITILYLGVVLTYRVVGSWKDRGQQLLEAAERIGDCERLRTIIDAVDDGIVVLDAQRRIVSANEAFLRRAKSTTDIFGHPCGRVSPCLEPGTECPTHTCLVTGAPQSQIYSRRLAGSETAWEEVRSSPILDDSGKIVRVVERPRCRVNLRAHLAHERRRERQRGAGAPGASTTGAAAIGGGAIMSAATVMLVDDDDAFRTVLGEEIGQLGLQVHPIATGGEAVRAALILAPDVELLDLRLPDMGGLDVLRQIRESSPQSEVIILTGQGSIETAVEAVHAGAADYVTKPCPIAELEIRIEKALERRALRQRARLLEHALSTPDPGPSFVGESPAFQRLRTVIERAALSDASALICGETGTGKTVVARLLHAHSARREQPFVVVECAGLQEEFLQRELFGHKRGAFTGATSAKQGLFQVADGGTIFLDEIGELSAATQAKLLRVLDDATFRPLGETAEIRVDVRVLAATHRDLEAMVRERLFREDLFYRLRAITIEVPPLRERAGDVAPLVRYWIERLNKRYGGHKEIAAETIQVLSRQNWPGNIRQLLHEVESVYVMSDGACILAEHLCVSGRKHDTVAPDGAADAERLPTIEEVERAHLERALRVTHGHRGRAAEILGVSERSLYRMLGKHGLAD